MRINTKTVETLKVKVATTARDISDGECRIPAKCMERIAIERALRNIDPKGGDHRVKIDGGIVKFNLGGYRWTAQTPKTAKLALIQFDHEEREKKRAEKAGVPFVSKVKPHKYDFEATKQHKITPFTPERQMQINEARNRRKASGKPDRTNYNLRKRVIGLGNV